MSTPTAFLDRARDAIAAPLGDRLVGLYVHGSIAFGCFTWARSDVDLVAVIDRPLSDRRARALLAALLALSELAPPKGLEISAVLREHCLRFVHPAPYELHCSPAWLDACRADPGALIHHPRRRDPDLAAHFTVIRAVGYPLCGAPVGEVFGPVPAEDYLDSIAGDVCGAGEDIHQNPVYVALNLCRALAFAREGRVLSKRDGGRWALGALPSAYHPLILAALRDYAGGPPARPDARAADAFAAFMLDGLRLPTR